MQGNLKEVEFYKNEIIDKENKRHLISWHNSYVKNADGKITHTMSSGIDVTKETKYIELLKYNSIFSSEFLKLTNYILSNSPSDEFYYKILEKLIRIVPHAEAGSFLLKNAQGLFEYIATYGYELKKLKSIKFKPEYLKSYDPYIIYDLKKHAKLNKNILDILNKYGRTEEIKETIMIPLIVNGQVYGEITLDTFNYSFEDIDLHFAKIIKSNLEFLLYKIELEEKLRLAAEYDYLTGIYSRQAFISKIKNIISLEKRHNKKIAFIYMDIDKFKSINDNYGHKIGDEVLKYFAKQISAIIRESDLFARLGGDEFIIALPEVNTTGVEEVISKIRKQFEKSFSYKSIKIKLHFSYGYSIYPDDSSNIDKLLEKADKMMYQNKTRKK